MMKYYEECMNVWLAILVTLFVLFVLVIITIATHGWFWVGFLIFLAVLFGPGLLCAFVKYLYNDIYLKKKD